MANYELYIGGPPSRNFSRAMFPSQPFDEAKVPFTTLSMASQKGPIAYSNMRLLDFTNDNALAEFTRSNLILAADRLGVVLIPKNTLFLGFYYKVEKAVAGITLTPSLRGKALTFTAINGGLLAEGFVAPGGGALVTEGVISLAAAMFDIKPDILDLTLTALPATKLAGFRMLISPVLVEVDTGGFR